MSTLRIPRGSSPSLNVSIYEGEAGNSPPLNLTGLPVAIVDSNLPIVPTISIVDAPNGICSLNFPDTSPMPVARSFKMRIRIGAPGDPGTFTTPYIEVITS